MLFLLFFISFLFPLVGVVLFLLVRRVYTTKKSAPTVAFFHPFSHHGGGGERVLWQAVRAIEEYLPSFKIILFTSHPYSSQESLRYDVFDSFGIRISSSVKIVVLKTSKLLHPKFHRIGTLFSQNIASIIVVIEALLKNCEADVFCDTTGFAFPYPLVRFIGGMSVIPYVHYPTISTDMLDVVKKRKCTYNNSEMIARSKFWSFVKLKYYTLFAFLYSLCGRQSSVVMVNSSWTKSHIRGLWRIPSRTFLVYPPCGMSTPSENIHRDRIVLSIAQFRPEKNHELQIRSFARFLKRYREKFPSFREAFRLVCVGSLRGKADTERLESYKKLANDLGVSRFVDFEISVPRSRLDELLSKSWMGLNTMWNEHFGIVVVEYMAAGVIPIAHNSGGPAMDIVGEDGVCGFLAESEEEFAGKMYEVAAKLSREELTMMRRKAVHRSRQFSPETFEKSFVGILSLVNTR